MNKHLIYLGFAAIIGLAGVVSAGTYSGGGNGTAEQPYRISTPADMNNIGAHPNDWGSHFVMVNDINLADYTGTEFSIIGSYSDPFTGVFDGNDHTISNFTYTATDTGYIGLFSYIDGANLLIKDLHLTNPTVVYGWNRGYVGSLVGIVGFGTITGCSVTDANVSGDSGAGGLVGENRGTISNSYATGSVSGYNSTGGLVGSNRDGTISNCYAAGSIAGDIGTGGLVGVNEYHGTISNCYATGNVLGNAGTGGLVGVNYEGTISNCYAEASVSGGDYYTGGLVGVSSGTISDCYAEGSVSGDARVGGLVGGNNDSTISNCYAAGSVTGTDRIGGLVGEAFVGMISNCYSASDVNGISNVGGFVGHASADIYTSCFWNSEINPDVNGIGNTTDPNVIGKTTAQMQTMSTFTDAGWDFVTPIWKICEGEDYPRLWWEKYGGGIGTAEKPYLIRTSCQMQEIGAHPNDWGSHFVMVNDINLADYTGTQFNVIGSKNPWNPFKGVFDGNGHTISNFTYTATDTDNIGLFGYIYDANAVIKDLTLATPDINAAGYSDHVASLVGWLDDGTINGCAIESGSVTGYNYTGGLVGKNYDGTISNCYAAGSVSGENYYTGGLVGQNGGPISNCYAEGSVTGYRYTGGLVGQNWGKISNCYAEGSVEGVTRVGGLVGWNYSGTIEYCYAAGSVTGYFEKGGLVGYYNPGGSYISSFWNHTVNPSLTGIGNIIDPPTVIGESTVNMQTESTFTDVGWDFVGEVVNGPNDIWRMCVDGLNYPMLWWEFIDGDFVCPDGVNFIDYSFFAGHWRDDNCAGSNDCEGTDLDQSGAIDINDLKILGDNWLEGV